MNAADVLKYGHMTFLREFEGVPESQRDAPGVCGVWSAKDVLAHLTSYELVLVDVLRSLLEPSPTPQSGRLDAFIAGPPQFGDAEVAARKSATTAQVLAEFNAAHEETLSLIARIPEEQRRQPGTLPWYGAEYALEDLIAYQYYGHKREHSAQIAAFVDRLSRG